MSIFNGIKHILFSLALLSLLPPHCSATITMKPEDQQLLLSQAALAFTGLACGSLMIKTGLLTLADIPTTSLEEIALSLRNQLSKDNLKKLQLGRSIHGYTTLTLGIFSTIIGLCCLTAASRTAHTIAQ